MKRSLWILSVFALVVIPAALHAIEQEDWRAKLPQRLRNAVEQIDWKRYYVVPQSRSADAPSARESAQPRGYDTFRRQYPRTQRVEVDPRAGVPVLVQTSIPWLPGAGNQLDGRGKTSSASEVIAQASAFTRGQRQLLGIDPDALELDRRSVVRAGTRNRYWSLKMRHVVRNTPAGLVPVRDAYVFFRVNHGNLVQFGNHLAIPPQGLNFSGLLSRAEAQQMALSFVDDPQRVRVFEPVVDLGQADRTLQVVLVNDGGALRHQLVRSFLLESANRYSVEVWLDAHTGEVVNIINQLLHVDGQVRGGIYPVTNTDPEALRGLPFVAVNNGAPKQTDLAGLYDYAPTGSLASAALDGAYVTISDVCGASSLATSLTPGDLSFGSGAGTDCGTPGFGGPGNTHSARSTYYHVNLIKEKARQYLNSDPATMTPWLDADLTANVNINLTCNAGWSPGSGTINFFKSGGGCSNTGEIAAVFLHEFGHGLDQNTNGAPPEKGSGEAYGDTMAFLQTHVPCIGHNFRPGVACSFGCDATCTGVRDVNVTPEISPTTITAAPADCDRWTCPYLGYMGPMGYEGHCESLIASGAMWDMAQAFVGRYGEGAGWALADRIWYSSLYDTESAYQLLAGEPQCDATADLDGCGANNWYTVFLALDDDDGNLGNGTPNADLIWTAFNNHGIACGAMAPPVSTTCTAPATPTLTAVAGTSQVDLSWTASAGATQYIVFRNEFGCGFGYTPVGTVAAPTTTFTDTTVANGMTYYYAVQAVGATDTCVSAFSACQTASPAAPLSPANIFMVLDESGSMSMGTSVASEQKIDALKDAAAMVIDLVEDYAVDGFRLGAVSFSTSVTGTETLKDLSVAMDKTALETFIGLLAPDQLTAIGQGINAAVAAFPGASPNQKVVMLLSDGIQNVPPNLELDSSPPGAAVGGTALPADVRFYTVALGTAIQEDLFEDLATSGGIPGFYYSGGTPEIQGNFAFWISDVLGLDPSSPFDAGGFDSGLDASAVSTLPQERRFQVNRTARRITFLLTWPAKGTDLRFVLDTPAGAITPPPSSFHPAQGYAAYTVRLPLRGMGPTAHVGEWTLRVTGPSTPSTAYALFDDPALDLDYSAGSADPGAGESFPLEARIFENGVPLRNLTVRAAVTGPNDGLGEVLSASRAQPAQGGGDPGDRAAQKLAAMLAQNPNLIGTVRNPITLVETSPGVYRAELPAARTSAAGTYVVDFQVSGNGVVNGPIVRTQHFSRYLRVKPKPINTLVVAQTVRVDQRPMIRLTITPRDRNNFRLGPGWASYVRVTTSSAATIGPIMDHLDGSYSTTIDAAGGDPTVKVEVLGTTIAEGPISTWTSGGGVASTGRRIETGPFLGFTRFDSSLPLDDGIVVGGRWSMDWTSRLAFETEAGATFARDDFEEEGVAVQLLQSFVWHFAPHGASVRPFVLAGAGAMLFEGFTTDDASLIWNLGAGAKLDLGSNLYLRFDGRDLIARDAYGAGTTHNLQLTIGLGATFP